MPKVEKRSYNSSEFVERREINVIVEAVADLAERRSVSMRAFSIADESGMGKTWTLRHLAEDVLQCDERTSFDADRPDESDRSDVGMRLSSISGVHSLYVDLKDWSSHFQGNIGPEQAIKYLVGNISLRVSRWRSATPTGISSTDDLAEVSLADLSRWLEADMRLLTRESVFVLLLDQVHEAPWNLLEYLDLYLLGPLAAIPRVLPVVAGRGQGYRWKSPEMQLHCRAVKLKPFDEKQTAEQLRRQAPGKETEAQTIHEQSNGYPRLSYFIATLGEEQGLRTELTTILDMVEGREELEEYLGAICVLRSFDDDRTVAMMQAWGTTVTRSEAAHVRKELMHYSFAFWPEKDATGWTLDGCLRFSREGLLRLEDLDKVKNLHRAARDLYKVWYAKYPETTDVWQPEADYHAEMLRLLS